MEARKLSKSQPPPFQLSLRIRHPSIDPADLSRELQLQAEYSFRAGEPRHSRSGLLPESVHAETYWLAILDPTSWPANMAFPGHAGLTLAQKNIGAALSKSLGLALALSANSFLTLHAGVLRRIRSEGGEVNLLVALSPVDISSFSLAPEVGRVFSELGITVEFEFTND